jgi:hypothetical protein
VSVAAATYLRTVTIAIGAGRFNSNGRCTAVPNTIDALARSSACRATYNPRLSASETAMEAERLNQIAATAASLTQRTAELRRYL